MKRFPRTTLAVTVAGAASFALVMSGCSAGAGTGQSTDENITLTVATFNEFGYEDLFAEYEKANPNITITHKKAATSNEARDNFTTRLAAGSGLADVEAVEVDWLPELMQYSDQFVDLTSDERRGPLARLEDRGRDRRRRPPHRLRHRHRPRGHLLPLRPVRGRRSADRPRRGRRAPRRRAGTSYFAVGEQFAAAGRTCRCSTPPAPPTRAWSTSSRHAYENPTTAPIIATDNPEVKEVYDDRSRRPAPTLSAHLGQWSDDWTASFQNDGFATMLCPGWMLGVISGNAEGVTGWDVADVFPGGGGNWGGSYLTVPTQSKHQAEAPGARRLADRPRAAAQGVRRPRAPSRARSRRSTSDELLGDHERVLQRRTDRRDLRRPRRGRHRRRRSRARTTSRSTTPCSRRSPASTDGTMTPDDVVGQVRSPTSRRSANQHVRRVHRAGRRPALPRPARRRRLPGQLDHRVIDHGSTRQPDGPSMTTAAAVADANARSIRRIAFSHRLEPLGRASSRPTSTSRRSSSSSRVIGPLPAALHGVGLAARLEPDRRPGRLRRPRELRRRARPGATSGTRLRNTFSIFLLSTRAAGASSRSSSPPCSTPTCAPRPSGGWACCCPTSSPRSPSP